MKKLFLPLVVALGMVTSAQAADWYISGEFQGWEHCKPNYKFSETSSGVFSLTLNTQIAGEFLIVQGTENNPDWNNKIGGASNMVADVEYTYVAGGNNFSVNGVINCTTIEFNTGTKKIKINGTKGENEYTDVYLIGNINDGGWNETITTFPLRLKSGTTNTYEGSYNFTAENNYFKMKAGSYIYGTGGEDIPVSLGTAYTASKGGNAFVLGPGEYTFTYVLEKNADTGSLTVAGNTTGGGGNTGGGDTSDMSSWYVNIIGPFNNWEDNGVNPVDGISTTENLAINSEGFKVKVWNGTADAYYISDGNEVALDTWTQLYLDEVNGPCVQIAGATGGQSYTVKFNCTNNQVYISKVGGGEITPDPGIDPTPNPTATTIYVVGQGDGLSWDLPGKAYQVGENGNFELLISNLTEFKFSNVNTTDWDEFNAGAYATGEVTFGDQVANAGGQTLPLVSWGDNQHVPWKGDYAITIKGDFTAMTAYTATPKPADDAYEIYVRGAMNDWGTPDAWKFNYDAATGAYVLNMSSDMTIAAGQEFKLSDADWGPVNLTYNGEVFLNETGITEVEMASGTANTTLSGDFCGTISIMLQGGTTKATVKFVSKSAAVESIEAAEAEAEYYNLQGVRVLNPEKGIFIKVAGGKAVKVVK